MEVIHIYAASWAAILTVMLLQVRLSWLNQTIDSLLHLLDPSWLFVGFNSSSELVVSPDSQLYPDIRLACVILLLTSNLVVILIFPAVSTWRTVLMRSGQLVVVNLIPLFLFSLRHSPLVWFAKTCQPEVLWAHYLLGTLVTVELILHTAMWCFKIPEYPNFGQAGISLLVGRPDRADGVLLTILHQGLIATVLLGLLSIVQIRRRISKNYDRLWCLVHVLLTTVVLVSCGLHLRPLSRTISPYYIPVSVLFALGILLRFAHTFYLHHLEAEVRGSTLTVQMPGHFRSTEGGLFAFVRGIPVCVAWIECCRPSKPCKKNGPILVEDEPNSDQVCILRSDPERGTTQERDRCLNLILVLPVILQSVFQTEGCTKVRIQGLYTRAKSFSAGQPIHFVAQGHSVTRILSFYQCLAEASPPLAGKHSLHWFCNDPNILEAYRPFLASHWPQDGDGHCLLYGDRANLYEMTRQEVQQLQIHPLKRDYSPTKTSTNPKEWTVVNVDATDRSLVLVKNKRYMALDPHVEWQEGRGLPYYLVKICKKDGPVIVGE
ncbi:MAG: hypothetical protein M1816_008247 [Peltula sp. TS41687]|nr:MAG: hypothetical protein M1816_008247 [Peltula sp. TS41687]